MRSQDVSAEFLAPTLGQRFGRKMALSLKVRGVYARIALSFIVCLPATDAVLARLATPSTVNSNLPVMPISPGVQIPIELIGAWQAQIEGKAFKLRTNFTVEIKIDGGKGGLPTAIVSYFAGDSSMPSMVCRSQLSLMSSEGQHFVLEESLNYKGGKGNCPIWDQMTVEPRSGSLWLQWRDGKRRKPTVKMQASAYRLRGGMECRVVSGDGGSGGQEWCRDVEGNWAPTRR